MQAKKNSIFENSNNLLDGTTGIVYLLYVGRENYAAKIQDLMTDALFADKSNVNQVMCRLTQKGNNFLISKGSYRKEGSRGRARDIYTANLDPLIATLNQFNIKFDERMLTDALTVLSEASDFFPKFLTNTYQTFIIRKLPWHILLATYFSFLSTALRSYDIIVYPIPSDFQTIKEKMRLVAEKNVLLSKELLNIFLQLSSPTLVYNPEFVEHFKRVIEELYSKESDMVKFMELLKGLQKEGISDLSVFLPQVRAVMAIYEKIDEIMAKLKIAETKTEEICNRSSKP